MTGEEGGLADIPLLIDEKMQPGEMALIPGCSWAETRPHDEHGDPAWRMTDACIHEHVRTGYLCGPCKDSAESTGLICVKCRLTVGAPERHLCECALEFTPMEVIFHDR